MDNQFLHDLAISYAQVKLSEYSLDKRDGLTCGNVDFSEDEINYFKSAYDFAIHHLSE